MQLVKKTSDYQIFKKRSGRYAVQKGQKGAYVTGDDKVKILLKEGLIKVDAPKKKEEPAPEAEAAAEEAPAEEAAAE